MKEESINICLNQYSTQTILSLGFKNKLAAHIQQLYLLLGPHNKFFPFRLPQPLFVTLKPQVLIQHQRKSLSSWTCVIHFRIFSHKCPLKYLLSDAVGNGNRFRGFDPQDSTVNTSYKHILCSCEINEHYIRAVGYPIRYERACSLFTIIYIQGVSITSNVVSNGTNI